MHSNPNSQSLLYSNGVKRYLDRLRGCIYRSKRAVMIWAVNNDPDLVQWVDNGPRPAHLTTLHLSLIYLCTYTILAFIVLGFVSYDLISPLLKFGYYLCQLYTQRWFLSQNNTKYQYGIIYAYDFVNKRDITGTARLSMATTGVLLNQVLNQYNLTPMYILFYFYRHQMYMKVIDNDKSLTCHNQQSIPFGLVALDDSGIALFDPENFIQWAEYRGKQGNQSQSDDESH